ncbi:response regulator [Sphingobium sp. 3R8]|uniref:response regulator n=1 Tax=Sphingobium sp. 3R8 TaxID=2874921 RepID=UPI001CCDF78A|nr:response regulator [Sphingobium sp. 3R8]MBZ9648511.1 response regulator [Sphingobium sp. 3R8]
MAVDRAVLTVLVVEDDALVRMHGIDILEDAGFAVLEAADADEALVILDGLDDVDLLFSDVDMPGSMSGLDLAHVVHERWPDMPVLLTSGHHRICEAQLPAEGKFVTKPWAQAALVKQIRDLLHA